MAQFIFKPQDNTTVLPVYNDLTCVLSSTYSTRPSFKYKMTPLVNGVPQSTIFAEPDPANGFGYLDPHDIVKDSMSFDLNYQASPILYNPNSIKTMEMAIGEEYSNEIKISSVQSGTNGNLRLNFSDVHRLSVNDRVKIEMDNITFHPQYNNYWKVITVHNTTSVTVDCVYVSASVVETGVCYEGVEFFDSLFAANGYVQIQTTNAHEMNAGDRFVLQMDPWAYGQLDLVSGSSGSVNAIYVNGVDILGVAVNYAISLANTAQLVATQINTFVSNPDYTAYVATGSTKIFIYSTRANGDSTVGMVIGYSTTSLGMNAVTPTMRKTNYPTNVGWNPQFTGTWLVTSVQSSTLFTTNIPYGNNTISGSERGSIINESNYKFDVQDQSDTVLIHIHTVQYDRAYNYARPSVLTNMPANQYYTNLTDHQTIDILVYSPIFTTPYTLEVNTYDANNNLQGTLTVTMGFNTSTIEQNRISIGIGPQNLNDLLPDFINNAISYYTIQVFKNTFKLTSLYTFKHKCAKHGYKRVMFQNRYGAFDYYNFYGAINNNINIESSYYYQKTIGKVIAQNGLSWGKSNGDAGPTSYRENSYDQISVSTGIINRDTEEWLEQLFISRLLFEIDEVNRLIPIQKISSNYLVSDKRPKVQIREFTYRRINKKIQQG